MPLRHRLAAVLMGAGVLLAWAGVTAVFGPGVGMIVLGAASAGCALLVGWEN